MEVIDYGVRNKLEERVLEFCANMNITVGNTLFKKRTGHLVIYESVSLKTQVYHCLVIRNKRKYLEDMKVLSSEECITKHKPLECDFKTRKVQDKSGKFLSRRKK